MNPSHVIPNPTKCFLASGFRLRFGGLLRRFLVLLQAQGLGFKGLPVLIHEGFRVLGRSTDR